MKKIAELIILIICVTVVFKNGTIKTYKEAKYFRDNSSCGFLGGCSKATAYNIYKSASFGYIKISTVNIEEVSEIHEGCE